MIENHFRSKMKKPRVINMSDDDDDGPSQQLAQYIELDFQV